MDKKSKPGIIYKHTSPSKKVFVGQTWQTLKKRAGKNGIGYDECVYFWNAIQKYGWDKFTHEIIYVVLDEQQSSMDFWEDHFITFYDSRNPEKGYNIKGGGSNGRHAEETKKKISKSGTGKKHSIETKQKLSEAKMGDKNPMFGKHFSEESSKKLSEALSGENHPNFGKHLKEETKIKIGINNIGKHDNDFTPEQLLQKSIDMSGENNPMYGIRLFGEANGFFGKKHSEASKEKMRQTKLKKRNNQI